MSRLKSYHFATYVHQVTGNLAKLLIMNFTAQNALREHLRDHKLCCRAINRSFFNIIDFIYEFHMQSINFV